LANRRGTIGAELAASFSATPRYGQSVARGRPVRAANLIMGHALSPVLSAQNINPPQPGICLARHQVQGTKQGAWASVGLRWHAAAATMRLANCWHTPQPTADCRRVVLPPHQAAVRVCWLRPVFDLLARRGRTLRKDPRSHHASATESADGGHLFCRPLVGP